MAEHTADTIHPALGLYLLGTLRGPERDAVERHLARCPRCLREATHLGPAASALGLLTAGDADDLGSDGGLAELR